MITLNIMENNSSETSIVCNINEYFKTPIYYNDDKCELKQNIIADLELIYTVDETCEPIYSYCFNNDNDVSKKITEQITKYYTTDVKFLQESQQFIKSYAPLENKYTSISPNYNKIIDIWNELKIDNGFKEKYYYIDWELFEFLNKSAIFLQFMSIYNLFSPIFSLMVPIIILIIPFIILKMKGIPLNITEYIEVLKFVAQTNAVGKLFTVNFSEINIQEKIYLDNTIASIDNYVSYSADLSSFEKFNNVLISKREMLQHINNKIKTISEYSLYNIGKFKEIGQILKYFYELHTDTEYEDAIMYSIGFNGYIDCIEGLQNNIVERKMMFATFINETKKSVFKNSYYKLNYIIFLICFLF